MRGVLSLGQPVYCPLVINHDALGRAKIDRAFVDKVSEDQAQLGWLEEQGCDYSQGFLHSKPLDIDTLLQFLADR